MGNCNPCGLSMGGSRVWLGMVGMVALIILDRMHLRASGVRGSRWSKREVRIARVRSRIRKPVEEGSGVAKGTFHSQKGYLGNHRPRRGGGGSW